jgi:hypothetical protein
MAKQPEPGSKARKTPQQAAGESRRKRLIVCFDGTWNTADNGGNPTNVVRLARAIPPVAADGVVQIVYYDSGVGTGILDRFIGGALGIGLEQNVKDGYLFLAQNYDENDEIYVFGFSRGAFTARSLCGFIGSCRGLLKRDCLHKLEWAWDFYRTNPAKRNKFRHHEEIERSVRNIAVDCVGVWDTVGSLGIPGSLFQTWNRSRYSFHDTKLSKLVCKAFHAVAIDEKRGPFVPAMWEWPDIDIEDQVVEQVWFPGVHSNIGGGYGDTDLSDLTLRWMMARVLANTNLRFEGEALEYLLPDWLMANPPPIRDGGRPRKDDPVRRANLAAKLDRLKTKWSGTLYESRSAAYAFSYLRPMIRMIAGRRPISADERFARVFPAEHKEPLEEAVHWSAATRFKSWRTQGIARYAPGSLSSAMPMLDRDRLKTVAMADELRPGVPWATARRRARRGGRGAAGA